MSNCALGAIPQQRSYQPPNESPSRRGLHLVVCGRRSCYATRIEMGHHQSPRALTHNLHRQSIATQGNWTSASRVPSPHHSTGPANHLGIPGNELADAAAITAATTTSDPPRPISARSLIRRTLINPLPANWGQGRCMAGSTGSKIAWPLPTERTQSS